MEISSYRHEWCEPEKPPPRIAGATNIFLHLQFELVYQALQFPSHMRKSSRR